MHHAPYHKVNIPRDSLLKIYGIEYPARLRWGKLVRIILVDKYKLSPEIIFQVTQKSMWIFIEKVNERERKREREKERKRERKREREKESEKLICIISYCHVSGKLKKNCTARVSILSHDSGTWKKQNKVIIIEIILKVYIYI